MGFASPETVYRMLDDLDRSFELLWRSYKDDMQVLAELNAYRQWKTQVKDSVLSAIFPSTISDEYEQWKQRYRVAYEAAIKRHPNESTTAPSPEAIFAPAAGTSGWFYVAIGGSVAVGLLAIALLRK